jgi:hypothetical protein
MTQAQVSEFDPEFDLEVNLEPETITRDYRVIGLKITRNSGQDNGTTHPLVVHGTAIIDVKSGRTLKAKSMQIPRGPGANIDKVTGIVTIPGKQRGRRSSDVSNMSDADIAALLG